MTNDVPPCPSRAFNGSQAGCASLRQLCDPTSLSDAARARLRARRALLNPAQPPQDPAVHSLPSLLDRRLVIVTGKGGSGKSTVCAALGVAAVRTGRRTLIVETGRSLELPELLDAALPAARRSEPDGASAGRPAVLRLDPFDALAEYLTLQFGFEMVVRRVISHRGFHQLLEGAPGWRELITLGKIWHLVERGDDAERPDLVIVDAPATGHGLTFLDVPRVATAAVRAGPLHRHAAWVEALLRDPRRTALVPVAVPEELSARETQELIARMREEVGVPVDRIVLNGCEQLPPDVPLDELETLLEARGAAALGDPALAEAYGRAVRSWRVRAERSEAWSRELSRETGLPTVTLPYQPGGPADAAAFGALADALVPSAGDAS
jgi:anion-transporting  ArsA/GET3 family ATPase